MGDAGTRDDRGGASGRGEAAAIVVIVLVGVLLRVADLGRQSPWLDETLSWMLAQDMEAQRTHGFHALTYELQALGLRLSDSTWGLRLPSAVLGVAALLEFARWARARLQAGAARIAALLFALSPMAIFYAQDANHYGPILLAGVLATTTVDLCLVAPERPRWFQFALRLALTAVSGLFHPVGVFATAALAYVAAAWLVVHADRLPPSRMAARTKRLALLALLVPAAAFATMEVIVRLAAHQGEPFDHARVPGASAEFVTALLADYFGAFLSHTALDRVLGVLGAGLAVFGCVCGWRRAPWLVTSIAALVLLANAPFFIFDFSHYFAPRYVISALPALLASLALAWQEGAESRDVARAPRTAWASPSKIVLLGFLLLFGVAFSGWKLSRIRGDHQPTYPALRWMAEQKDALFVTRHRYSARVARFHWQRMKLPEPALVELPYTVATGAGAVQRIRELLATRPEGAVYFFSFIEDEEWMTPDFRDWMLANSAEEVRFASATRDEFVPINWKVSLRRIDRSKALDRRDPFALPREGITATAFASEEDVGVAGVARGGAAAANLLYLAPANSASWVVRFDPPRPGDAFAATRRLAIHWRRPGGDLPPPAVVVSVLGGGAMTCDLRDVSAARGTILCDLATLRGGRAGEEDLELLGIALLAQGTVDAPAPTSGLAIERLEIVGGTAARAGIPATALHSFTYPGDAANPAAGGGEHSRRDDLLPIIPTTTPLDKASFLRVQLQYGGGGAAPTELYLHQWVDIGGIGANFLHGELHGVRDSYLDWFTGNSWTAGPVLWAARFRPQPGSTLMTQLRVYQMPSLRPINNRASATRPEFLFTRGESTTAKAPATP